ncbi:MAG: YgiQ family radical SAM protein [Bacillota bacterium]|nr:YgiQ family radical SAM protein [Bacillota bacterium]
MNLKTDLTKKGFLPMTRRELDEKGIKQPDFICVTGDAYVDHPSFGFAIITRVLEAAGYSVAVLAQPNMHDEKNSFTQLEMPKYGFFVTGGNIDSMVAHYSVSKHKRREDSYSPGGKTGKRPDRAVTAYCKALRKYYPNVPIVIGGLEASLRRFAHYDYWADSLMPSVLIDSGADILIYGMGELQTVEIADRLSKGDVSSITDVRGTCVRVKKRDEEGIVCPSLEEVTSSKRSYAESVKIQYQEQDPVTGKVIYQKHGDIFVKQNKPMPPLTTEQFDAVYELPFMNTYHPSYEKDGGVPAIEEVEFSMIHNRGCFGACNFCALTFHQGRRVTSRSKQSLVDEAVRMTKNPRFKGYIHDVGGPTANFRHSACKKQETLGACKDKRCLAPVPCKALEVDHSEYLDILKTLRELPKVKKVFIRSGIRFDYLMLDKDNEFFRELVKNHISGQLKVAPEHVRKNVLNAMGKPPVDVFDHFCELYTKFNREYKKDQYLVPYLMSSHPGSTLEDALALALYLKRTGLRPEQVQDFYPTPGTISTCMFYTGIDPITGKHIYVPKNPKEKEMQRALLQYYRPSNYSLVREALKKIGRDDLIGYGQNMLVPPSGAARQHPHQNPHQNGQRRIKRR